MSTPRPRLSDVGDAPLWGWAQDSGVANQNSASSVMTSKMALAPVRANDVPSATFEGTLKKKRQDLFQQLDLLAILLIYRAGEPG